MKRTFTLLASAALMFGTAQMTKAQTAQQPGYLPCGTDQAMEAAYSRYPGMREEMEQNRLRAEQEDHNAFLQGYPHTHSTERNGNESTQTPPTYTIAVVFHIVHDYGSENISDAQVLDAMRILNEDYRKLNADTSIIVPAFQNVADDTEIEFRLAQLDPNGNCTNGIDRIASVETYIGDDGSKLNPWNRARYLNVWVVKQISSGAAGYSLGVSNTVPSAIDGVIILSQYVGSIGTGSPQLSRALTHEIGHHLNLDHTWGNNNNPGVACGNDGVSDTPITKGWTSCNLTTNDVCNNNVEENVQNYMDYSYCSRMFSAGQGSRMRSCLQSSTAARSTLVTATTATQTGINNTPTLCAPIADFGPADVQYVCAGGSLTFTDYSYNGQPTNYSWTFQGGTPPTITGDSTPTVQYNTAGTYSVGLTVSNAAGSDAFSRSGYVIVVPTTATYQTNWSEGMESTTTFNNDWDIINAQGNGWTNSTTAAATGSRSARLDNTTSMAGTTDEMIGPTINLSALNSPSLTFKVAFAQRNTSNVDRLRVYVSTDCGRTWNQRYSKSGATLSTRSATTSAFVPTASEWRTETVTFTSTQMASTNARIKFTFESDGGNDIYLDDINIQGAVGVTDQDNAIGTFDVYPNPAQDNTMIEFSLDKQESVNVEVMDLNGKIVQAVYAGQLNNGVHRFPVNTAELSSGIYLVRLMTGEGNYLTRKLIVE
jgi:PKD repeat protein